MFPTRRNRVIDDSDCDTVQTIPLIDGSAIAASDVPAMHRFFEQFAGCRHKRVAPSPGVAPEAEVMDLRAAVPKVVCQFLDLESKHVALDSDDSSGHTNSSGSDSCYSFISHSHVKLSVKEIEYVEKYISKALPATAALLREMERSNPPATTSNPKPQHDRAKQIITIISSSSSSSSSTPPPIQPPPSAPISIDFDNLPYLSSDSGESDSDDPISRRARKLANFRADRHH